jgi:secondary thiamine-phosphate synthase enzyme
MLREFTLRTSRENWINITPQIREAISESGIAEGLCHVHCPHTTAGITINENADPDVVADLIFALNQTYHDRPEFRHMEGNSAAHLKSSVIGCGVTLTIHDGKPLLGMWQGVYFCEFDGPRTRRVCVAIQGEKT